MSKEIKPEAFFNQESIYQELFNYMYEQHDCVLLNEDMHEIILLVNKIQGYVPPEE